VGDEITVKIIKLHEDRIGLSIKALQPHPWDVLKSQYNVGDVFEGTVTKVIPHGLLIALTEDYSGLMPRNEYSWNINERLDGQVQEGEKIKVKIMAIDDERRRISLSHRETVENAWNKIKLRRNDVITVTFVGCEEKGAKVAYGDVFGFMPISEVTSTRRIMRADEVFKEGDLIDVVVLDVDPQRAKLVVSAKANEDAKEKETFEKYFKDQANKMPTNTLGDMLGDALKKFEKTKKGK
jgi:small subunit ribosomal protein S1